MVNTKVFLSYYHKDDQEYKEEFEERFGHLFINKSVKDGDIADKLNTDYIKRLIQLGYLKDTSVLVVLLGENTQKRKHVDWEISASINKKVGNYSGLIGLLLPTHPAYNKNEYSYDSIPPRLADNVKTGYAKVYNWTEYPSTIKRYVNEAFARKNNNADLIDNSRPQFKNNR
ncbi:hypothetical protein HNP88_000350 [Methanococcus maripaludis]|uniref:Thoeris protein ThsB TIR-like domain-containing protein n=1 Tax=Methanococcus maripaludis TaxID=39152 RepID=A0A7J9NLZ7_METMI|nr:TIR domain-containing protein [Methanococcus maripaludis]MBA2846166.1 hypothetical protein [Methanococcus maripaludis]